MLTRFMATKSAAGGAAPLVRLLPLALLASLLLACTSAGPSRPGGILVPAAREDPPASVRPPAAAPADNAEASPPQPSLASRVLIAALHNLKLKDKLEERMRSERRFVAERDQEPAPVALATRFAVSRFSLGDRPVHILMPRGYARRGNDVPGRGPAGVAAPEREANPAAGLVILFLHGGAYNANFQSIHWDFIGQLVARTGAVVVAPDYPLTPAASWTEAYAFLDQLAERLPAAVPALADGARLVIMGDSAGGGLALAWTMSRIQRGLRGLQSPERLILLSPWLNLAMDNPDSADLEPDDPLLSVAALRLAAALWAGDTPLSDWRLSPLRGPLAGLPPISLYAGGADILTPDARAFAARVKAAGLPIRYREYPGMVHDWMLVPALPEALACQDEIVAELLGR